MGGQNFVTTQQQNQWLASKLKGTDVIGPDNAKIGDVSDIVLDRSGAVAALVVGVGGFLGIGSKDVAMSMSAFQVQQGQNGQPDQLKVSMTKEQLKDAPEFKPLSTASNTSSSGSSTTSGPGSTARPSTGATPSSPPPTSPPNSAR
jgi:hypothetical protein